MGMKDYAPPVDILLTIGDIRETREWPDYLETGLGPEHTADLIRMATDEELNEADSESVEVWAPIHAWRVLGQLRALEAVEPLLGLFDQLPEDDWVGIELPKVLGKIGPAAIPALTAYAADDSHDIFPRIHATEGLSHIAKEHPAARDECLAALARQLESFDEQDPVLNAFIISSLMDIKGVEAASIMERAFAADCVDESIVGDWDDVQVDLELKEPSEKQLQLAARLEEMNRLSSIPGLGYQRPAQPKGGYAKAKTKRKQAKKSRKKNRRR